MGQPDLVNCRLSGWHGDRPDKTATLFFRSVRNQWPSICYGYELSHQSMGFVTTGAISVNPLPMELEDVNEIDAGIQWWMIYMTSLPGSKPSRDKVCYR